MRQFGIPRMVSTPILPDAFVGTFGGGATPTLLGLVLNGDFEVDDPADGSVAWSALPFGDGNNGVDISGGVMTYTAQSGGLSGISQDIAVTSGASYQVSGDFVVAPVSGGGGGGGGGGGSLFVGVGSGPAIAFTNASVESGASTSRTSTGALSFSFIASSTTTRLDLRGRVNGSVGHDWTADNISLVLVPEIELIGETTAEIADGPEESQTVSLPAHESGDFILISRSADSTINDKTPVGYTDVGTVSFELNVAYKFSAGETTVEIPKHDNRAQSCVVQVFRNVDASNPINVALSETTAASATVTFTGVTTTRNGALVYIVGVLDDDINVTVSTSPAGYTNTVLTDAGAGSTANSTIFVGSKTVATAGLESPPDLVFSSSDTNYGLSFALQRATPA